MSRRAYTVLTTAPDMTDPPVLGLVAPGGRVDKEIGQQLRYSAWVGKTLLALSFQYRASTPAVAVQLRNFANEFKGRGFEFLLPSWIRDFRLAAAGSIGDTTLTIEEAGLSDLATDRPDTEGRVIFVLTPNGELQILGVLGAADGSPGQEVLTLDEALTFDLDIDRTMVGFVYLVRLADDSIEWRYDAPGQCSTRLRFVTVCNRRQVDSSDEIQSADVGNLKGIETLLATDEDPYLSEFAEPIAIGPTAWAAAQGDNFGVEWQATFNGSNVVQLEKTASPGSPINSSLYNSGFESDHLSLAFDSTSREALAWRLDEDQFRIGFFKAGVETYLDVGGQSPVLFQTWTIDGTVTSGDAELVCVYLKRGFSNLFCRLFRDDFATEYVFCRSTTAPLYLQRIVKVGARMEVQGMDHGHRRCRWQSFEYQTPLAPEQMAALIALEAGVYEATIISRSTPDEGAEATIELEAGLYESIIVQEDVGTDPGVEASIELEAGLYESVIINEVVPDDGAAATINLESGAYTLVNQEAPLQTDEIGGTIELETGTYEQP